MAVDFTIDPFRQAYNAIWTVLEANSDFTDLVKKGNRIKLVTDDETPIKKNLMVADFPEVMLFPTGGTNDMDWTSSNIKLVRSYQLVILSGTMRANKYVFPIEWLCLKILYTAIESESSPMFGLGDFVDRIFITPSTYEYNSTDENENRTNKDGWVGGFNINIEMAIAISDITIT